MLEPVIGLEIHVQLLTRSKLFCGDDASFGGPPNSRVCPVCLGLPGALPVVNRRAVELGVRAALGLGCAVHPLSEFARKHYFYPDLPKGYQITQHDRPLATEGWLGYPAVDGGERRVRIRRVHLEEDSGRSLHDRVPGGTAIDLNRAGVPLIEIVTEPDLRSPEDARALLGRMKQALQYLEVSDCSMEEGSLRVDANISLRGSNGAPGPRSEIKNLNSFGNLERALRFEILRQRRLVSAGERVEAWTLLWDATRGEARPLRAKEEAPDYRFFPEPDLPPLVLPPELVERQRAELPEMPWDRVGRLEHRYGLPRDQAEVLCATRALGDFFEAVVAEGAEPREAANWVQGEVLFLLNEKGGSPGELRLRPPALAELLRMLAAGEVTRPAAKRALARMAETGERAEAAVRALGLERVDAPETLQAWTDEVLRAHPAEVERYRGGEKRLLAFFVGRVMRRAGAAADPQVVVSVLRRSLGE